MMAAAGTQGCWGTLACSPLPSHRLPRSWGGEVRALTGFVVRFRDVKERSPSRFTETRPKKKVSPPKSRQWKSSSTAQNVSPGPTENGAINLPAAAAARAATDARRCAAKPALEAAVKVVRGNQAFVGSTGGRPPAEYSENCDFRDKKAGEFAANTVPLTLTIGLRQKPGRASLPRLLLLQGVGLGAGLARLRAWRRALPQRRRGCARSSSGPTSRAGA